MRLNVPSNVSCYGVGREVLVKVLVVEAAKHSALDLGLGWDACFSLSILSP